MIPFKYIMIDKWFNFDDVNGEFVGLSKDESVGLFGGLLGRMLVSESNGELALLESS